VISLEKRAANRRNASKSTGPKTQEGKRRSSKNALVIGVFSNEVLIPGDDVEQFRKFRMALCNDLQPEGAAEYLLVENMICAAWRLRRLAAVEAGLFARGLREQDPENRREAMAFFREDEMLGKLTRYEAALNRTLYRAYHEFERRQAARLGHEVAPPTILDIEAPPSTASAGVANLGD
jgi:hypothetical protein